jgi:hypothetical protein
LRDVIAVAEQAGVVGAAGCVAAHAGIEVRPRGRRGGAAARPEREHRKARKNGSHA